MALTFRLKAGNVPASQQCLSTLTAVLKGVEKFVEVIGPDGVSVLIISKDEPAQEDRDKAWLKLDANGFPFSLSTYKDGWKELKPFHKGMIALHSGLVSEIPVGWKLANGISPSVKNLTTRVNFWEGGNGGNAGHYSATATEYAICPIEFVGYQP